MDIKTGFEVLQWVWGEERSPAKRRLRFTIFREINFFDPLACASNPFLEAEVDINGERVNTLRKNWKLPEGGISKIYS